MPHIPKQHSALANFYARCKNPNALEGKRGGDRPQRTGWQLLKADLFRSIFGIQNADKVPAAEAKGKV